MKAIVLSSGGVDSTTCVGIAVDRFGAENVSTISVTYGQKHSKELECADNIARHYGVEHIGLDLTDVLKHSDCPLLDHSGKAIKHKSYADQIQEDGEGCMTCDLGL